MYPETLVMVAVERKVSDRSYSEEYLYNEKGALLFYFQKAENDDLRSRRREVYILTWVRRSGSSKVKRNGTG